MHTVHPTLKKDDVIVFLNKALNSKGGGGLTCLLPDSVFKQQCIKKVLEIQNSEEFVFKEATKIMGKLPEMKNLEWVISDKVRLFIEDALINV